MDFIPKAYISGLELSNISMVNSIGFCAGECASKSGELIILNNPIIKNINFPFEAGDNLGGLFSGSVSANTWYHVFIIKGAVLVDCGFDISANGENIPSGYTEHQWIGAIKTDESGLIINFYQSGNIFLWDRPVGSFNTYDPGILEVIETVDVPTGITVKALLTFNCLLIGGSNLNAVIFASSLFQSNQKPSSSILTVRASGGSSVQTDTNSVEILADNAKIRYRSLESDSTLRVRCTTNGWVAPRAGKFSESVGSQSSISYEEGEWVPKLTLANEGDLDVTYDQRSGYYTKIGRMVSLNFYIRTDSNVFNKGWSYTTGSGALVIEGVPFDAITGTRHTGSLSFGGIEFKDGHTTAIVNMNDSGTRLTIDKCGSGVDLTNVDATEVPSGNKLNFRGSIVYHSL